MPPPSIYTIDRLAARFIMENSYGFIGEKCDSREVPFLTFSLGLGAMGYPMAKNIRQNLHPKATFWIFDVDRKVCDRFLDEFGNLGSISIASSAKEVAQNALTIVSIVPAGRHVHQVYLDPESGVIASKGNKYDNERVYVECSTIDMQTAVDVGKQLAEAGMGQYVDCPVSVS